MFRFSQEFFAKNPDKRGRASNNTLNIEVLEKIENAKKLTDRYLSDTTKADQSVSSIMCSVLDLQEFIEDNFDAEATILSLFAENKIKVTKKTPNAFVPLVKLVAGRLPRETIGRTAAILDFAHRRSIRSDKLESFVADNGGVAKCAKSAKASAKPTRDKEAAARQDVRLQKLRQKAKPLPKSAFADDLSDGLWRCLVEKRGDKTLLLAIREEVSASSYKSLVDEKKPRRAGTIRVR